MLKEDREAFLAEVHIGVLSVRHDPAAPLAVPLWYSYMPGEHVRILTGPGEKKTIMLEKYARASLCVQDETPPYRYVTVEGPIVSIDPAHRDRDFRFLVERYLPDEWVEDYYQAVWPSDKPIEGYMLIASLSPERWFTVDYRKYFSWYFEDKSA
jgi:nitroimidazol reductase NimA-like FMN-containing flavoprotein (pyridoxamine 5'-phosphate oxidase superfamily)